MANDPQSWIHKLFPTNRRLFVRRSFYSIDFSKYKRVLVIGAGNDPYRNIVNDSQLYLKLDIVYHVGITDVVADAHKLPFHDSSFDCVIGSEVFEHLHHPEEFINEVFRVLQVDGGMFLSIPFMFHEHGDPYDYWRPTKFSINECLHRFSDVSVVKQGNRFHVIMDLITTGNKYLRILVVLRVFNHIFSRMFYSSESTAPSGFFISAVK